ncbi:MAG: radical SAM family heme chaperone HemW [Bacillus sp. (in: Bacteria)]|nr:radical SAM family heme chaperone HemW [Bacillus sp. (in: firmicutes)]MCM1426936.1 radical SAM family heme chaperone HemW [Eubacterium sp.]
MRDLSLYLHIPFCERKCRYCDFLSYPATETEKEDYITLLLSEIEKRAFSYKEHQVISVFIGGGTPSILKLNAVERLIEKLKLNYTFSESPEITIEANPDSVTAEKLAAYHRAGINRLSIGLQSADDKELKLLGRLHDYAAFCNAYEMARAAGFQNINIDIMSAIPGQTLPVYQKTLERILAYRPEHISAYSMILEEGTWFYEHQKELPLVTEDEDRMLYQLTGEMLASFGYNRYEISNYAKPGYECIHNKVYWQRGDYVGFGLGAASMVKDVRWNNKKTYAEYAYAVEHAPEDMNDNMQYLTVNEQMEEFMFLGLRLTKGIEKDAFFRKFGVSIESVYGSLIEKLEREGLLIVNDFISLTPYGMDISNYVMAQFLY